MPRLRPIPFYTALLTVLLCAFGYAAEPSPWMEVHSAHFTVITDAGANNGREIALRFEQMRSVFGGILNRDRLNQSIPLTILALGDDKMFYQVAPLQQGHPIDKPGFFLKGDDQDFIVLNLSESDAWRSVAHDFALMELGYNYPTAQGWFDEGLAQYFRSIRIVNRQVEIGGDPGSPSASLVEILKTKQWRPLPELFATKAAAGVSDPLFNAQSWIAFHYLLHEKRLEDTGTYFGLALNHNVPIEDAIKQAYGMSAAQLDQGVKDYFKSNFVDASTTAIQRSPAPVAADDSVISANQLSVADARAIYAGVQVRVPERRDLGLKTLQDLATTPTDADKKSDAKRVNKRMGEDEQQLPNVSIGDATAHRILAWDNIEHGNYDAAFKEIGDAASLNQHDMWVRYYLCVAKYRMAQAKHTDILGLANMMIDLRSVLEWYPEMANAYDLLAVARNAGGSTPAALEAQRAAISLSPRDELYRFHLAQIYVSSKKWDAAGTLLNRLKDSSDPHIADMSRELLSQAGTERKYGISANAAQPKLQPQKTPFDVLDEDAAKRESAAQTTESDSRRPTKFVKGQLIAVDCSKSPIAVLTLHSTSGTLKLKTSDYRSILLIGADNFSCAWHDVSVTANYKAGSTSEGDLVSLEVH